MHPAPAVSGLADGTLVIDLAKGRFMEHPRTRNRTVLMFANCTETTTAYDSTTKGATGLFTTIHAEREEVVDVTYRLVVWPTVAEQGRRLKALERLDKDGPRNDEDTLGHATQLQDVQDEMMMFFMMNFGSVIEAIPAETADATAVAEVKLGGAQSKTGTNCGSICATSPRALGVAIVHHLSPTPPQRATQRKGRRGRVRSKEESRRMLPEASGIVIMCMRRGNCKQAEELRCRGSSLSANSELVWEAAALSGPATKPIAALESMPMSGGLVALRYVMSTPRATDDIFKIERSTQARFVI